MDVAVVIAAGVLGPLVVLGLICAWNCRGRVRRAMPGSRATRLAVLKPPEAPRPPAWEPQQQLEPQQHLERPHQASGPARVGSLAGLPIRRPAAELPSGDDEREMQLVPRMAVRRAAAGDCPECEKSRRDGRNYCVACRRRLTPFLS